MWFSYVGHKIGWSSQKIFCPTCNITYTFWSLWPLTEGISSLATTHLTTNLTRSWFSLCKLLNTRFVYPVHGNLTLLSYSLLLKTIWWLGNWKICSPAGKICQIIKQDKLLDWKDSLNVNSECLCGLYYYIIHRKI